MPLALIKPVRQSSQNGMAGGKVAPSRLGVDARVRMFVVPLVVGLGRNLYLWRSSLEELIPSLRTPSRQRAGQARA